MNCFQNTNDDAVHEIKMLKKKVHVFKVKMRTHALCSIRDYWRYLA